MPGEKVVKPTDPTREGYTFAGWYTDESLTQVYDFSSPIDSDVTLYAKWVANSGGVADDPKPEDGDNGKDPVLPSTGGDIDDKSEGNDESKNDELAKTGDTAGVALAGLSVAFVATSAFALIARKRAA